MFQRTTAVVASALMMSGAAIALSPAAQAAPATYTGHVQVIVNDEIIGCAAADDYYYAGYTSDPDVAYDVAITEGQQQELLLENDPTTRLGSPDTYNMSKGQASSYTFLLPVPPGPGTPTALWSIDPTTRVLSATWTWPDSTTEPVHSWSYENNGVRYVGLAVDVAAFSVAHSGPLGVAATFRVGEACSGPVVSNEAQAIAFTSSAPSTAHPGDTYTVAATGGDSGKPVTFASTTTDHCTIDGATVTFGTPGTCTIEANQAGAGGYDPAPTATQDITVSAIASDVSVSLDLASISEDQHAVATAVVDVAAGSLAAAGGAVQFAVDGTDAGDPVAIDADGLAVSPQLSGAVGTREVTATYVPADATNYEGSTASAVLTITTKAAQTITFTSSPPSPAHATQSYTVAATGGESGKPVTFTSTTTDVCTIDGASVSFERNGTCTIEANQAGATGYAAAESVTQDITVDLIPTTVDLTLEPGSIVTGQGTTAVVQVDTAIGSIDSAGGAVEFRVDGDVVDTVDFDDDGRASLSLNPGVGTHRVQASWSPETTYYDDSRDEAALTVSAASTTTKVTVAPSELSATVTPVAPGAGTPTGDVNFFVDGVRVGTAALDGGIATLAHTVPNDQDRTVSAEYAGGDEYTASSSSTARANPVITARVTSSLKSRNGWYRRPVTISFTCETKGAALVTACPKPVTVSKQRASSITRTIHAVDGGIATATTTVKLDRSAPRVGIKGVKAGRSYFDAPKPKCIAKDSISGVAKCTVTTKRRGSKVIVRAKAIDVAGNVRTKRVAYRVATFTIRGAKKVGNTYRVKHGETYTLLVRGAKAHYVYATPAPGRPNRGSVPFTKAGKKTWALGVTMSMTTSGTRSWNLGYTQNGKLHIVKVKVTG